jgi:hypothetical protein
VTRGADRLRLCLAGGGVGGLDGWRKSKCGGQGEQSFHGFSPKGGDQAVNSRYAEFIPGAEAA